MDNSIAFLFALALSGDPTPPPPATTAPVPIAAPCPAGACPTAVGWPPGMMSARPTYYAPASYGTTYGVPYRGVFRGGRAVERYGPLRGGMFFRGRFRGGSCGAGGCG